MSVVINGITVINDSGQIDFGRLTGVPAGAYKYGTIGSIGVTNCAANGAKLTVANCSGAATVYIRGGAGNCSNCTNNCTNCINVCGSCFAAGTKVHMADGSLKNIEEVVVGDVVLTSHGQDTVRELWLPILADRPLIQMKGGGARVSSDHPFWSRDPKSHIQFWCTRDYAEWLRDVEFSIGSWFGDDALPFDLSGKTGQIWEYATIDGFKEAEWEFVEGRYDLPLYHLLLENHGSYFADGFLVCTQADKCDVDWKRFHWDGHPTFKNQSRDESEEHDHECSH